MKIPQISIAIILVIIVIVLVVITQRNEGFDINTYVAMDSSDDFYNQDFLEPFHQDIKLSSGGHPTGMIYTNGTKIPRRSSSMTQNIGFSSGGHTTGMIQTARGGINKQRPMHTMVGISSAGHPTGMIETFTVEDDIPIQQFKNCAPTFRDSVTYTPRSFHNKKIKPIAKMEISQEKTDEMKMENTVIDTFIRK